MTSGASTSTKKHWRSVEEDSKMCSKRFVAVELMEYVATQTA